MLPEKSPRPIAPPEAEPEEPAAKVNVRGVAVTIIAVVLVVLALRWAQVVLIPVVLSVLISYALDPLHRRVMSLRVPRNLAAGLVVIFVTGLLGTGAYALRGQASAFVGDVPKATVKLRAIARDLRGQRGGAVDTVHQAAEDLKKAAAETAPPPEPGVVRVQIDEPVFRVSDLILRGSVGVIALASQAVIVVFLVYYTLASGDLYKRRLVHFAGRTFASRRLTVEILQDVTRQIEQFLLARVLITVLVGSATGLAFWALGMPQPAIWGVAAGVANNIPYIGPAVVGLAAVLSGLIQFNSLFMAIAAGSIVVAIASLEEALLTPWIIGRAGRLEPGIIFLSLTFWGWLWGIWGMLLAVPILMVIKAICDHVEGWGPVSEVLKD